jgi:hypothetical protein
LVTSYHFLNNYINFLNSKIEKKKNNFRIEFFNDKEKKDKFYNNKNTKLIKIRILPKNYFKFDENEVSIFNENEIYAKRLCFLLLVEKLYQNKYLDDNLSPIFDDDIKEILNEVNKIEKVNPDKKLFENSNNEFLDYKLHIPNPFIFNSKTLFLNPDKNSYDFNIIPENQKDFKKFEKNIEYNKFFEIIDNDEIIKKIKMRKEEIKIRNLKDEFINDEIKDEIIIDEVEIKDEIIIDEKEIKEATFLNNEEIKIKIEENEKKDENEIKEEKIKKEEKEEMKLKFSISIIEFEKEKKEKLILITPKPIPEINFEDFNFELFFYNKSIKVKIENIQEKIIYLNQEEINFIINFNKFIYSFIFGLINKIKSIEFTERLFLIMIYNENFDENEDFFENILNNQINENNENNDKNDKLNEKEKNEIINKIKIQKKEKNKEKEINKNIIDWKKMKLILNNEIKTKNLMNHLNTQIIENESERIDDLEDIIYSLTYNIYYIPIKVRYEMNPLTKFPSPEYRTYKDYYEKKYNMTNISINQPLIEVKLISSNLNDYSNSKEYTMSNTFLLAENIDITYLPKNFLINTLSIPYLFFNLEKFLLSNQLKKELNIQNINSKLFLDSLTSRSISEKNNYERFEYLGDTILKFLIVKYLFNKFPHLSEGNIKYFF